MNSTKKQYKKSIKMGFKTRLGTFLDIVKKMNTVCDTGMSWVKIRQIEFFLGGGHD